MNDIISLEEPPFDWLTREVTQDEMEAITNIQKTARGFLQRRIALARTGGTEKNLKIHRALQSTMAILKVDSLKSALLLFK
jgi:ABC-type iron transport system FetAB ATPase subunit